MYTIAPPKSAKKPELLRKNSFWRYVLYAFIALLLLALVAFGALFFYLKHYPHNLSQSISSELYERTGVELVFSSIDVTLLPLPALSFANVELKGKEFTLDVAYATVTPSLISLIKGEFTLGKISLWRPVLNWHQKDPPATSSQVELLQENAPQKTERADNMNKNITDSIHKTIAKNNNQYLEDIGKFLQENMHSLGDTIPSLLHNSSLQILHGNFSFKHKHILLQSENINANLKLGLLKTLDAEIVFKNVHILSDAQLVADLGNFTLGLSGNVGKKLHMQLSSYVAIPNVLEKGNFSFSMDYVKPQQKNNPKPVGVTGSTSMAPNSAKASNSTLSGNWSFDALLSWKGAHIPLKNSGNFFGDIIHDMYLENVRAVFDQNSAIANASLNLRNLTNPILKGHINIENFSLTQWFGFARQLPLGLRRALDVIKGELNFTMDKRGLHVPQLTAMAAGASFKGNGSVKSWKEPVIFLEAFADALELKNILPELEGLSPAELSFAHEPLTPIPGAAPLSEKKSDFELDYDINIHAKSLVAFDMPVNGMSFRCLPTDFELALDAQADGEDIKPLPKKHEKAVTLEFSTSNFHGGKGNGRAVLYNSPKQMAEGKTEGASETIYEITARLQNVAALKPITRIVGKNLVGGTLSLNTQFTTKGKYVSEILTSKRGDIELKIRKGVFYSASGKKTPFRELNVQGQFSAKPYAKAQKNIMPPKLQYAGKWQANLDMPDILANGAWSGSLEFAGKNYGTILLNNFAGSLSTKISAKLASLPKQLQSTVRGNFFLNTNTAKIEVKDAKADISSLSDLKIQGSATLNYAKNIVWSAEGAASTSSLDGLMKSIDKQGKNFLPPTLPSSANLQFSAKYAKNNLRLENLSLASDDMRASGHIICELSKNPHWKFDLHLNNLNYDKYFPKKSSLGYTHVRGLGADGVPVYNDGQEIKNSSMSWQWLQDLRVSGALKIGLLRISKMQFRNISTDIGIDDNILQLKALTGTLYGGTMDASFWGALRNNTLQTRINFNVKAADLLALTKDLQLGTVFSGKSNLTLALTGELGRKNVLSGFTGQWSLYVGKGFMQSSAHNGKLIGRPTMIDSFSDNGQLRKGVLQSQNLKLLGPDMQIRGNGYINFIDNTLDMRLNADLGYIVDIPVRFHGELKKPERTLNAGAVVIAALGSLGTGVFDLIGGIFGTIFGVFE